MTLMARLCALCALCAMMQMALGDTRGSEGLRMIGGLLMMHLVISGAQDLCIGLIEADGLMHMIEILIG